MPTDFLKLPFSFEESYLLSDLHFCLDFTWKSHFNISDYSGDWKIIALRSPTGAFSDINTHSQRSYSDTELMIHCKYFRHITDLLECEKEAVRLMSLAAGSTIKSHKDNALSYMDGDFRLHIPIQTEPEVKFYFNDSPIHMGLGETWYGDFGQVHRIEHTGSKARIHLVIDCVRNNWSDKVLLKRVLILNSMLRKNV